MHVLDIKSAKDFVRWSTQNFTAITFGDLFNAASVLALFLILYAGLYLCIGEPFLPGREGSAWAVMVVWLGGHIGAVLAELINIPAPVGMICSGLFLRNVGNAVLISGLKKSWSKEIRGAALAVIFLRSGLELDFSLFRRIGVPAVKLLFIPGLVEAFFDGGLAAAIFNMPVVFGFSLGFILKAIGPALAIQLMFEVQQRRLGTAKELPKTVVAAASFDDMIAITGYTIFISIAVHGSTNKAWHIAEGPLSVVFGALLGAVAAVWCAATLLWNNKYKRICILVLSALAMKYFFDQFGFTSGGAIGSLTLGLLVKVLWRRKWPALLASKTDEPEGIIQEAERAVRFLWRFLLMPLLFCLIGATINFSTLPSSTIAKACAIIFAGLAVRMVTTFLTMLTSHYSLKECTWFMIAWIPKATVQAALAALPLDAVKAAYKPGDPNYAKYLQYGEDALTTAVFEILISGTLGSLFVRWLSPLLLQQEAEAPPSGRRLPKVPSSKGEKGFPDMHVDVDLEGGDAGFPYADPVHSNLVEEQLERLEEMAEALVATGERDGSEEATEYGQRLRAGIRALTSRLQYNINPKDIIGADAYREAVIDLNRRMQAARASRPDAASNAVTSLDAPRSDVPVLGGGFSGARGHHRSGARCDGGGGATETIGGGGARGSIEITGHVAPPA